jgi:hypothetical protein
MDMYSELTSGVGQLNTWAVYKGHIHVSGKKSTTFGTRPPSAIMCSSSLNTSISVGNCYFLATSYRDVLDINPVQL